MDGGEEMKRDVWERVCAAGTLREACDVAGIRPRTVGDVKVMREKTREFAKVEGGCTKEWKQKEWNRDTHALIVCGGSQIGKTNWAIAQFERAFVIEECEDLKAIPEGCTGLVFDGIGFYGFDLTFQKRVFDAKRAHTLQWGSTSVRKPHLPMIFCTNDVGRLFKATDDGVVAKTWYVSGKCYVE
jgi:hypothetical protein